MKFKIGDIVTLNDTAAKFWDKSRIIDKSGTIVDIVKLNHSTQYVRNFYYKVSYGFNPYGTKDDTFTYVLFEDEIEKCPNTK